MLANQVEKTCWPCVKIDLLLSTSQVLVIHWIYLNHCFLLILHAVGKQSHSHPWLQLLFRTRWANVLQTCMYSSCLCHGTQGSLVLLLITAQHWLWSFQTLIFNLTMDWSDLAPNLFLIAQAINQSWLQIKPQFIYPSQISSNLYIWMFDSLSLPE